MGLTGLGLLSLHEQMEQDSGQGELSIGSQLGRGQDSAVKPVAVESEFVTLTRNEGRLSSHIYERQGCKVGIGGSMALC